eukprot:532595-Prorocentrum_minimum.AAC.1
MGWGCYRAACAVRVPEARALPCGVRGASARGQSVGVHGGVPGHRSDRELGVVQGGVPCSETKIPFSLFESKTRSWENPL